MEGEVIPYTSGTYFMGVDPASPTQGVSLSGITLRIR
jgi:hypothetical protein